MAGNIQAISGLSEAVIDVPFLDASYVVRAFTEDTFVVARLPNSAGNGYEEFPEVLVVKILPKSDIFGVKTKSLSSVPYEVKAPGQQSSHTAIVSDRLASKIWVDTMLVKSRLIVQNSEFISKIRTDSLVVKDRPTSDSQSVYVLNDDMIVVAVAVKRQS
jgi:hypothetical protein